MIFVFGVRRRTDGELLVEAAEATPSAARAGAPERVRRVRRVRVPGLRPRAHRALQNDVAERAEEARDDEQADGDRYERHDVVARRGAAVVVVVPAAVAARLVGRPRRGCRLGLARRGDAEHERREPRRGREFGVISS